MMEIEIVQLIQNVGFPIAMCVYFVFRFEKILKTNTDTLQLLISAVQKLCYGRTKTNNTRSKAS